MKLMALCLFFIGCGPTCEQQGGKWVQDGWYYVQQTIGRVTFMQPHPNYICKKDKNQ